MNLIQKYRSALILIIVLAILALLNSYNFLLFHGIAELAAIAIAWGVFLLVWNSRIFNPKNPLIYFGISLAFVGFFDLLHTLAYKGMNIFTENDANLPTQFWIAARYFQSISFAVLPFISAEKFNHKSFFGANGLIFIIISASIFAGYFPDCYIEGAGLTQFKIFSEYIISFILFGAVFSLYLNKNKFNKKVIALLTASYIFTIISELLFTFYIGVYDISNVVGHLLKFSAFYLIYKAIIETTLNEPFETLFKEISFINQSLKNELSEREAIEKKHLQLIKELDRSNKDLEQFAYVASHDLQEPLRMVTSYTQLIARRYKGKLDSDADDFINYTVDAAVRMQKLIADLLQYSRLNTGAENFSETDLNLLLDNAVRNLSVAIEENNARIIFAKLPKIKCDSTQIYQVLQNLISNAIKFKSETPPVIEISAEEKENEFVLKVKDNGIGIDEQYQEKVFIIFNRLNRDARYKGTGIGLAIAKKIVERHNGKIYFESTPGKGTTFIFTISKYL